jgi:hypothetical protein
VTSDFTSNCDTIGITQFTDKLLTTPFNSDSMVTLNADNSDYADVSTKAYGLSSMVYYKATS